MLNLAGDKKLSEEQVEKIRNFVQKYFLEIDITSQSLLSDRYGSSFGARWLLLVGMLGFEEKLEYIKEIAKNKSQRKPYRSRD